jgi:hypothetical protein
MKITFTCFRIAVEVSDLSLSPVQVWVSQLAWHGFVFIPPFSEREDGTVVVIVVVALRIAPHISCVMQYDIQDDTHIAFMRFVHQLCKIFLCAEARIDTREVDNVVTVIGFRIVFKYGTEPQCCTAKILDVVEVSRNALQCAAARTAQLLSGAESLLLTAVVAGLTGLVVVKPVDYEKINKLFPPFPGAIGPVLFPRLRGKVKIING